MSIPDALVVVGVRVLLEQVLVNLLLNAGDACEPGDSIRTSASSVEGGVQIQITDTGSGIDAQTHARIFEPFFTTRSPNEGTGLGLSICQGIIDEHRGHLEVDSMPGQGTTVTIFLPNTKAVPST